jgi:hypothetical protein
VIACYRPKTGKVKQLVALMRNHVSRLRVEGLVTDRVPILMQSSDDTVIEVFEWKSSEAIEQAHSNPAVLEMWKEFERVCEYVPLGRVPEAAELFSEFTPLE